MKDTSQKRHIAKTITWRIVGTLDTIFLSGYFAQSSEVGLFIGITEVVTKMILYYLHERAWFKINLSKEGKVLESSVRHIAKTITWRTVGTIDTFCIAWFYTGDSSVAIKIGGFEVITKMILYYLHERVWYKSNFGLKTRSSKNLNDTE